MDQPFPIHDDATRFVGPFGLFFPAALFRLAGLIARLPEADEMIPALLIEVWELGRRENHPPLVIGAAMWGCMDWVTLYSFLAVEYHLGQEQVDEMTPVLLIGFLERRVGKTEGPVPPCHLVWGGIRHPLSPTLWRLADYMWNRQEAPEEDVVQHVWGPADVDSGNFRATVSKLSTKLLKFGVPWSLHCRNGFVTK
jgi:hypothetical protein